MTILNDEQIVYYAQEHQMIYPFYSKKVSEQFDTKVPSFGLSSFGYDVKLGDTFTFYRPGHEALRPCQEVEQYTKKFRIPASDNWVEIGPGEFVLAHTVEHFNLPYNITGLVCDKSTYARLGIAVQNTVLEAGWRGQLTLEITNHGPRTVELCVGAGIAQILFFQGEPCMTPYDGKYQDQKGVTLPR